MTHGALDRAPAVGDLKRVCLTIGANPKREAFVGAQGPGHQSVLCPSGPPEEVVLFDAPTDRAEAPRLELLYRSCREQGSLELHVGAREELDSVQAERLTTEARGLACGGPRSEASVALERPAERRL